MARTAVEFVVVGDELHLIYRPRDDTSWVYRKFKDDEQLVIKRTFYLTRANLAEDKIDDVVIDAVAGMEFDDEPELRFVVARAEDEYFRFDPKVLPVGVPVLFTKQAKPTWKWFSTENNTSVLAVAAELMPSRIVIGGSAEDAVPIIEYVKLVNQFPTGYELKRYVLARVGTILRQYTDAKVDAEAMLQRYVAKRISVNSNDLVEPIRAIEVTKFQFLLERLKEMLACEDGYSESLWQDQILAIVRLLNPKYIAAFKSVHIADSDTGKGRQLDILLVDASGNVDVIEIKKPFNKCVMSDAVYRDNHIPLRELSGSIMQIEKYIFHLSRWGRDGEEILTKRFASKLPTNFRVRIVNPSGLVIMGRDHNLSKAQRRDFEIFRRQTKNIVDVITYDDLLRRLEAVLEQLKAGR